MILVMKIDLKILVLLDSERHNFAGLIMIGLISFETETKSSTTQKLQEATA
jgi:hypothetical protein